MKNVKVNRNIYNFIILFICFFGTEIILRLLRGSSIFNWATFRIIISSSLLSLIFSMINCHFKRTKTLNLIIILLVNFYACFQLAFFQYIGTYASLNSSGQAYKVLDYIWDFLYTTPWFYYLEFIPFVALILYYIITGPVIKKISNVELIENKNHSGIIRSFVIILILVVSYYLTLIAPFMKSRYQVEDNINVFRNPDNQSTAVDQFGITMFFVIDVNSFFFAYDSSEESAPDKNKIDINSNNDINSNQRVVDNEAWNKVIEEETNNNYITLNNYFSSRTITEKNDLTGIFKGKNVIFIMMESVNLIPFSDEVKEYFPTLNKLYDGGMTFTNFFSPRSSCSTGNNEMSAMLSLYPINNNCTANAYKNNKYPEAVFYKFRELGYTATSYHDYIDAYYSRGKIHTNMGSQKYYNAQALGIAYNAVYQEWPSDTELFTKGVDKFINDEHFMAYMTTVTSHQPYGVDSEFGNLNLEIFKDVNVSKSLQRYLSKVYELEKGLTILMDTLEKTGKLEDTVLVLYGDHYPYYFSSKHLTSLLGDEVMEEKNVERTPLIIYNAGTEGKKIDTYATIIDILPTVMNLFDIEYDPRLYLGTDLFDEDAKHIAVFIDGSWQSELGYYNSATGKFEEKDENNTYTDEEIFEINTEVTNKLKMSALALKTDYMNHLFTAMEKYSVKDDLSIDLSSSSEGKSSN